VHDFRLIGDFEGLWRLGQCLPSFNVEFIDEMGNRTPVVGDVKFDLTATEMKLTCEQYDSPVVFRMEAEENGHIGFEEGQWLASPLLDDGSFISAAKVDQRSVEFTLNLMMSGEDEDSTGERAFEIQIGTPKTFTMLYSPGYPYRVEQLTPSPDLVMEAVSGDSLQNIRLVCLDYWGNRTAPRPGMEWNFKVEENDYILCDEPAAVLATGEAVLRGLSLLRSEALVPREGIEVVAYAVLECDFGPEGPPQEELPRWPISVLMKPSSFPDKIEVQ
jgi:hypothetical protein